MIYIKLLQNILIVFIRSVKMFCMYIVHIFTDKRGMKEMSVWYANDDNCDDDDNDDVFSPPLSPPGAGLFAADLPGCF